MLLDWTCKKFQHLTLEELYAIIRLRNEVFVVEQHCIFQDADNKDQYCHHLMGWHNKTQLAAYARLVPPQVSYMQPSIGRIVTSPNSRKSGYGQELLSIAIEKCKELFGETDITIGAQLYLKRFYESFDFAQTSNVYDEDGIDHIEMTRKFNPH